MNELTFDSLGIEAIEIAAQTAFDDVSDVLLLVEKKQMQLQRLGSLLTAARGKVAHGEWSTWIRKTFAGRLSVRSAQLLIAEYKVPEKGEERRAKDREQKRVSNAQDLAHLKSGVEVIEPQKPGVSDPKPETAYEPFKSASKKAKEAYRQPPAPITPELVEPTKPVQRALDQLSEILNFCFENGTDDERDTLLEILRPIWLQLAPPSLLPVKIPAVQAGLAIANTVVEEWNMIDGVTVCRAVTPARRKRIADRFRDPFWKENWKAAIDKVRQTPALQGANDQNWRADLDWFLRPDTVARVIEGKYDNWKPSQTNAEKRSSSNQSAFDEVFG